jgi:hypothetical protein
MSQLKIGDEKFQLAIETPARDESVRRLSIYEFPSICIHLRLRL